jgi:predicted Zn-dependent hydrolases of the beta-lactamase fold
MTENIEVFTQSSIKITDGENHIYIDPLGIKEEFFDADYILITHDHYDHFSPEDIKKVACENTVLIVPEKMKAKALKEINFINKIESISPNQNKKINSLYIETIPAYNIIKPFHLKIFGWVGYILEIGGKRIYIAGDTDKTKEAEAVHCDIAMVPIGGTYTMNAKKAAELINIIQPEVAIPTHYGSIVGNKNDGELFKENVKAPVKVELKLRFN